MPPTIVTLGLDAMRTRFEFVLGAGEGGPSESALRDAGEAALREVEEGEARLSLFRRDSLLSHLNRTAPAEAVRLDADTLELLLVCREVWEASGGAFDPTVAPRLSALGLHEGAQVPEGARLVESGFGAVEIDVASATVRFRAPVAIDLGGVAKGHALDLAGRVLREAGVTCGLLHGGTSSVLAIGRPAGETAWKVGVRHPEASGVGSERGLGESTPPSERGRATRGGDAGPTIELRDLALGVSAHHGRWVESAGGAVTHVLDPRTGEPARSGVRVAAVTGPTAALADAWSTAALVLGRRPCGMPVDMGCVLL